jgi:hypothetical protein
MFRLCLNQNQEVICQGLYMRYVHVLSVIVQFMYKMLW